MDLNEPNLDSICRTCMGNTTNSYDIFSNENDIAVADLLNTLITVKITKEDQLPKIVCPTCYSIVMQIWNYKKQAEDSDAKMRLIVEQYDKITWNISDNVKQEIDDNSLSSSYQVDLPLYISTDKKQRKATNNINYKFSPKQDNEIKREITEKNIKICNICGRHFRSKLKLECHIQAHNDDSIHINSLCPKSIEQHPLVDKSLNHNEIQEMEFEEQNKTYECDNCPSKFKSSQSLAAHKRLHAKPGRVLACSICGKVFKKVSHLKRHELIHEANRPYKCCLCSKSFNLETGLVSHMEKHRGCSNSEFKCSICSKDLSYKSSLKNHLKLHAGVKEYLCPICGKRFDSSSNLKQHVKRHVGDKPFECSLCPKKFVSKGELKAHTVSHTHKRAWTCDECGASFTMSNSLAKHKLRHSGVKTHECDTCPMKFLSKDHLKRHSRIHTGERPYKCNMCERSFTQSNDLIRHKKSHVGDRLYECDQCSSSFRLKSELTQHLSDHYVTSKQNVTEDEKVLEYSGRKTVIEHFDQVCAPKVDKVEVS